MRGKNAKIIEFLNRYQDALYKKKKLEMREEEYRKSITGAKAITYSDMPGGSHSNEGLEKYMVELERYRLDILDQMKVCVQERKNVINAIESIEGDDADKYKLLLSLRYINCFKWDRVTEEMAINGQVYSLDNVKGYMHGKALDAVNINTL